MDLFDLCLRSRSPFLRKKYDTRTQTNLALYILLVWLSSTLYYLSRLMGLSSLHCKLHEFTSTLVAGKLEKNYSLQWHVARFNMHSALLSIGLLSVWVPDKVISHLVSVKLCSLIIDQAPISGMLALSPLFMDVLLSLPFLLWQLYALIFPGWHFFLLVEPPNGLKFFCWL